MTCASAASSTWSAAVSDGTSAVEGSLADIIGLPPYQLIPLLCYSTRNRGQGTTSTPTAFIEVQQGNRAAECGVRLSSAVVLSVPWISGPLVQHTIRYEKAIAISCRWPTTRRHAIP